MKISKVFNIKKTENLPKKVEFLQPLILYNMFILLMWMSHLTEILFFRKMSISVSPVDRIDFSFEQRSPPIWTRLTFSKSMKNNTFPQFMKIICPQKRDPDKKWQIWKTFDFKQKCLPSKLSQKLSFKFHENPPPSKPGSWQKVTNLKKSRFYNKILFYGHETLYFDNT